MPTIPTHSANHNSSHNRWGAASRFDFDDPNKWVTVPSVPLLDEHELTNDSGQPIATVDRAALEEIARNNNHKVVSTGDPATLILGHTSDDPRAPEKPAKGFVVNYAVKPFRRLPNGKVVYAIHGDYKLRPQNAHLVEEYPRRSVELWWARRDIDPVAMLGGSSPERDLGAVIRNARLNHVSLAHKPVTGTRNSGRSDADDVIRFRRRGQWTVENYAIDPFFYAKGPMTPSNNGKGKLPNPNKYNADCGPGGKTRYGEDDMDPGMDTHDPGDEGVEQDGADDWTGSQDDTDTGGESPAVRELLQSKAFRDLQSKIDQLFTMLTGGGGADPGDPELGGVGGDDSMPGGEMPPPEGGMDAGAPMGAGPGGPGGPGGGMPPGGDAPMEEESRRGMGERPVQMGASTGFPGQSDVFTPGFDKGPNKRMSRRGETMGSTRTAGTVESRVQRLERENAELRRYHREDKLRYSQSEAARRVEALVSEGYLFGATPQDHAEGVAETQTHFANLLLNAPSIDEGIKDVEYEESIVRRRYARKRPDPIRAGQAGLSRYTRDPVAEEARRGAGGGANKQFEFESDDESCEFADLVTGTNQPGRRKYSREEAEQIILRRRMTRR